MATHKVQNDEMLFHTEGCCELNKSRKSFACRWIRNQAELRCPVRIWALEPFAEAAAVRLTETHCIHQHGICDLSDKQQTQQNRFGLEASGHPVTKSSLHQRTAVNGPNNHK